MLDMGFIPDVRRIIAALPAQRQSLFFSATLPSEVITLSKAMVKDPVKISIDPEQPTVEAIEHKVLFVNMENKPELLVKMLSDADLKKVLVFTRTKYGAVKLAHALEDANVSAVSIHGNKSQPARMFALAGFRNGKVRTLVATDIAARGIDVEGITHVFNYDLPSEPDTYVHRVGRTARAGASGIAITFCSASERTALRDIEKLIRKPIPVDSNHDFHSETAQFASGADARPAPRVQRSFLNSRQTSRNQSNRVFGNRNHSHRKVSR
jgi:ATP-dependent RNA helicase RhlE